MVSVIIPNYNHARYLVERLDSVLNQSFTDIEVLLMDDCSSDDSRSIIEEYAARDARIRVVLNEQNSGSTFKQWNKGIALTQGEYVWLAESDDYADPNFLATLVARLDADPEVGLVYCDSFSVDENGALMPVPTWEPFLAELDAQLWKQDFTKEGLELVLRYMSYRNIIPNASAVLLRRTTLAKVGAADESYRVLGDWLFWARILSVSNLAFVARPLNYFRTHRNNVRSKTQMDGTVLVETTRRLAEMRRYGKPDEHFYSKALDLLFETWFYSYVYYAVPAAKHRLIYRNMVALDATFRAKFYNNARRFLLDRKLAGLKMIIGDKVLPQFGIKVFGKHRK
jgi:glycosyltransferase involved in cell wall biosynthesis